MDTLRTLRNILNAAKQKSAQRYLLAGRQSGTMLTAEAIVQNPYWFAYAGWQHNGAPVTLFRVQWTVPQAPRANDQALFHFPGMCGNGFVLQPILLWGKSAAGGGDYWTILSMYAATPGNPGNRMTGVTQVNPGDVLSAYITAEPAGAGKYNYSCGFDGFEETKLHVPGISVLSFLCITLEAFYLTDRSDYPPAEKIIFTVNDVTTSNGTATPVWKTYAQGSYQERAALDGQDIHIYY